MQKKINEQGLKQRGRGQTVQVRFGGGDERAGEREEGRDEKMRLIDGVRVVLKARVLDSGGVTV